MGFFDKMKTQASTLGRSINDTTAKLSSDFFVASRENAKLTSIKAEIDSIEGDLQIAYNEIGKKYVEHISTTGEYFEIGVQDTIKRIEPKLDRKQILEKEAIEIQKMLKDQLVMQEKATFQREYDETKEKLYKALKMDIISESEYSNKLAIAKEKLDNFDEIRRIKKQCEMELITKDEMDEKLSSLGIN